MDITAWDALNAFAALVVPFILLAITALGRAFYILHQRLTRLEEKKEQQDKTLYGDPQDAMHDGLTHEVREMKRALREMEEQLDAIRDKLRNDD